jgi:hypothetical protein
MTETCWRERREAGARGTGFESMLAPDQGSDAVANLGFLFVARIRIDPNLVNLV